MDASSTTSPEVLHGRYQVVRTIGHGELGRTFEVRDQKVEGDPLALKLLELANEEQPGLRDAFLRRATAAEDVSGDHVRRVRGNGVDEADRPYMLLEYVESESLQDRLEREDALQPRHAVDIALQVLDGLASLHEKGLIHGNLRPGNVLLKNAVPKTRDNPYGIDVKVAGFGLPDPKERGESGPAEDLYLAPDWADEETVDARANQFPVSLLLCEMLRGSKEFRTGGAQRLREAILAGDEARVVAQLQDIQPSLRRPLIIGLSRRREDRFPGNSEFQDALRNSDVFASEKMRAPVSLVVAALIVAVVGAVMAWRTNNQLREEREQHQAVQAQADQILPDQEQLDRVTEERDAALEHVRRLEALLEGQGAAAVTGTAPDPAVSAPRAGDEDWAQMLAAPARVGPEQAFELARTGDGELDPRLLELLNAYREGLLARVVKGGSLDRSALAAEPTLLDWARLLEATAEAKTWPAARDVRFTGYARRFLVGSEAADLPWQEVFRPATAAVSDWRHDPYLRARFVQETPWLLKGESEATVYARRAGSQLTFVKIDFAEPPTGETAVCDSTILDSRGDVIARRQQRVVRQDAKYSWDTQSLDLRRASATVQVFEPGEDFADLQVPRQAGVRLEECRSWRERVEGLPEAERLCLVVKADERELWLSPTLGLVRLQEGTARQELIVTAPRN